MCLKRFLNKRNLLRDDLFFKSLRALQLPQVYNFEMSVKFNSSLKRY